MAKHEVGTREEWLAARVELLESEKDLTRRSDELARQRRELPWVRVDKEYAFETDEGTKTLSELFDARSQLLVFHFMFGPEDTEGCPGCSFMADHVDGAVAHLEHRDVTFVAASRGPLEKLDAYKQAYGLELPVGVVAGKRLQPGLRRVHRGGAANRHRVQLRYATESRPQRAARRAARPELPSRSRTGSSTTRYSCYDRGTDVLHGTWQLLDRAPEGRGEKLRDWPRRHDEY